MTIFSIIAPMVLEAAAGIGESIAAGSGVKEAIGQVLSSGLTADMGGGTGGDVDLISALSQMATSTNPETDSHAPAFYNKENLSPVDKFTFDYLKDSDTPQLGGGDGLFSGGQLLKDIFVKKEQDSSKSKQSPTVIQAPTLQTSESRTSGGFPLDAGQLNLNQIPPSERIPIPSQDSYQGTGDMQAPPIKISMPQFASSRLPITELSRLIQTRGGLRNKQSPISTEGRGLTRRGIPDPIVVPRVVT